MACLEILDEDFDDMHHALGRPSGPEVPYWRNSFCTERGGEKAKRFEALGFWTLERLINDGRDAIYHVNAEGKLAVEQWLELRRPPSMPSNRIGIDQSPVPPEPRRRSTQGV